MAKIYGHFGDFERFWSAKNKAKQSQSQVFGRKFETKLNENLIAGF
jgi:hypothetical protein